jgi:hypothetical protein
MIRCGASGGGLMENYKVLISFIWRRSISGMRSAGVQYDAPRRMVLAGVAAIRAVHGDHPHLQMAHSKYLAHISGYKNSMKNQNRTPKGPKFGSLGGSSVPGAGPNAAAARPRPAGAKSQRNGAAKTCASWWATSRARWNSKASPPTALIGATC